MEQSESVYEAADMAARQIEHDLPGALEDFRKNNPNEFQKLSSGSVQILMAGMSREGEVQVARRSIPYDKSRRVETENTSASEDHIGIAAIGESNPIDKEVERLHNTDGWVGTSKPTDLKYLALRFIALEIVDKPGMVGPPVSVALVDSDGIHWDQRGACQQKPLEFTTGTLRGHYRVCCSRDCENPVLSLSDRFSGMPRWAYREACAVAGRH
jgi:hypothetical protein